MWKLLPGRGEGLRVQEERCGHQIQALVSEALTQKLGAHPPLGQAGHTREGRVLLLESGEEGLAVSRGSSEPHRVRATARHSTSARHCPHMGHIFSHALLANTREVITNVTTKFTSEALCLMASQSLVARKAEWGQEEAYIQQELMPCLQSYPCRALVSRGNSLVSLSRRRDAGVSLIEIIPSGLRTSFRICGSR